MLQTPATGTSSVQPIAQLLDEIIDEQIDAAVLSNLPRQGIAADRLG